MYHEPVRRVGAVPVDFDGTSIAQASATEVPYPRLWAVLILCSLPLITLVFLLRFAWRDLRALGRGVLLFHTAVVEELSGKRPKAG